MFAWPQEAIDDLKAHIALRVSAKTSAELLEQKFGRGLTRQAVLGKAKRLGLRFNGMHRAAKPIRKKVARRTNHGNRFDVTVVNEPLPLPKDRPASEIPFEQRKTLLDLTARTCRFPYGDPGTDEFFFCGADCLIESPYCGVHMRLAYTRRPSISETEHNRRSYHWRKILARRKATKEVIQP